MPDRPGPNDILPCPSDSARRRHLALGEVCDICESPWYRPVPVVVCHGREVDDEGRHRDGEPCGARFRPPGVVGGRARMAEVDRLVHMPGVHQYPGLDDTRPPTAAEVAEMARAKGWALPDPEEAAVELVGTCPRCRRPTPEATALAKEVQRRG